MSVQSVDLMFYVYFFTMAVTAALIFAIAVVWLIKKLRKK